MVVTCAPAALETGVTHERIASPFKCTVHAPHWEMPQPYLVPLRSSTARSTQRSGMSAGAQVTTIEGLSPDGTHALQRAWEELDVPQCGYCQAGQLMMAAALLAGNPKPTDADIDEMMEGNLCRCGTYLRIRQAIHRAAGMPAAASVPAGKPTDGGEHWPTDGTDY